MSETEGVAALKRIAVDSKLLRAFDAWRAGGLSEGHINPSGGLFLGKAECEWIGLDGWKRIAAAGLVEITIHMKRGLGAKDGGPIQALNITATDAGVDAMRELDGEDFGRFYRMAKE